MQGMSISTLHSKFEYLSKFRSLAGFTLQISFATMVPLTVDGGFKIAYDANIAFDSVGILYPGERVDLFLQWDDAATRTDSQLHITLDPEYAFSTPFPAPTNLLNRNFKYPNPALSSN
jgi:hypothetical protein